MCLPIRKSGRSRPLSTLGWRTTSLPSLCHYRSAACYSSRLLAHAVAFGARVGFAKPAGIDNDSRSRSRKVCCRCIWHAHPAARALANTAASGEPDARALPGQAPPTSAEGEPKSAPAVRVCPAARLHTSVALRPPLSAASCPPGRRAGPPPPSTPEPPWPSLSSPLPSSPSGGSPSR